MEVRPLGRFIEVRDAQPENVPLPMVWVLWGKEKVVRELQFSKASSPMEVTLLGRLMEVIQRQPKNALLPMDFIELGRIMEVSLSQLAKA